VGGMPLAEFCYQHGIELDEKVRRGMDMQVRQAAYHIIEGKGATYYGIGSALARIVDVILRDQRAILTVCSPRVRVLDVCDVTISLPNLVGGAGVLASFPLPLNEAEAAALKASAETVCRAIEGVDALERGQVLEEGPG
jgi:L-lactate dehydrogenase